MIEVYGSQGGEVVVLAQFAVVKWAANFASNLKFASNIDSINVVDKLSNEYTKYSLISGGDWKVEIGKL